MHPANMVDLVVFEWMYIGPVIVSSEWVTGTLPRLTRNRASDLFRERAVLSETWWGMQGRLVLTINLL